MKTETKQGLGLLLAVMLLLPFSTVSSAFADGTVVDGVAGCQSIAVDPEASLEMQDAVCNAAEQSASSSCATSDHGMCSSPKKDGTMMDGRNCLCINPATEDAPLA